MKNPHTFKLVDGKFSPNDARKVMIELIQNKINFHSRVIHMMEEHNEGKTAPHEKRIAQLKKSAETLKKVLLEADKKGMQLKVKGTIEITFLD
jgi:hemerythrin superfamily protein